MSPKSRGLTRRQKEVFAAIKAYIEEHDTAPTYEELSHRLGIEPSTAHALVRKLVDAGYVDRSGGEERGIRLNGTPDPAEEPEVRQKFMVEVLSEICAGDGMFADSNREGWLSIDPDLARKGNLFAHKVRGESMIGAGIRPGDHIIIRRQPVAEPGEIVAVAIGDRGMVKRLRFKAGRPELHPENPKYRVIHPDPNEHFQIHGKVIAIQRHREVGIS